MSIDISQFHAVFFEESFEGLELMEQGLLSLEVGVTELETINTIFRAAHSIKGGAGTFGFADISKFTHAAETLLDEIRNNERELSQPVINALLRSVDVLRDMLQAARDHNDYDRAAMNEVSEVLSRLLADSVDELSLTETSDAVVPSSTRVWQIRFAPHRHLLQTGNDPLRILSELAELGELTVTVDDTAMPAFVDMDPENCYLAWKLELRGDVSLDMIAEVFEWVEDECDLEVVPVSEQIEDAFTEVDIKDDGTNEQPSVQSVSVSNDKTSVDTKSDSESNDNKSAAKATADSGMSSIRVGTDKIDSLMNLVGELVITQSMLSQIGDNLDPASQSTLIDGLEQLERNTRELQEGIMRIRMLPISFAFNRFPRLVHDLSHKMNKKVELRVSGEQTELDKTVMEKIGDPLVHLVRNSLDHGIENPEARLAAGKPEVGILQLNAFQQAGSIVIEIADDGAGLNEERILTKAIEKGLVDPSASLTSAEIFDLIFLPGFSTAESVSDISGRGVGMDVVRRNISSLGGSIEVRSIAAQGSRFTIRLPLTLAIMDGQIIQLNDQRFIIPLLTIIESVEIKPGMVKKVTGKGELFPLRDDYIPLVRLHEVLGLPSSLNSIEDGLLVVVDCEDHKVGLLVDELLAQQQVVIKNLETNYRKVDGFAGATILGDGAVALILDIPGIVTLYRQHGHSKHTLHEQVA